MPLSNLNGLADAAHRAEKAKASNGELEPKSCKLPFPSKLFAGLDLNRIALRQFLQSTGCLALSANSCALAFARSAAFEAFSASSTLPEPRRDLEHTAP